MKTWLQKNGKLSIKLLFEKEWKCLTWELHKNFVVCLQDVLCFRLFKLLLKEQSMTSNVFNLY